MTTRAAVSRWPALVGGALGALAVACAPTQSRPAVTAITVEAMDYAFQLPDTLRSGPTTFRLHNRGKVPHEMGMALLKAGVTMDQLLKHIGAGGDPDSLIDGVVGILIASPGDSTVGALAVEMLSGRTYALFCNFKDAPDKPEHVALGMFSGRTVTVGR